MKKAIPQKYNKVIQVWRVGGGVEVEYIPPSGQIWDGFSKEEKEEFKGLVAENGQDADALLGRMVMMLPR